MKQLMICLIMFASVSYTTFAKLSKNADLSKMKTQQLDMTDDGTIIAFTGNGSTRAIQFSTDSGLTWPDNMKYTIPYVGKVSSGGCALNRDTIYVVDKGTRTGTKNGCPTNHIIRTTDGCKTWEEIILPITEWFFHISCYENVVALAGDNGTVLYSNDYGETWEQSETGTENSIFDIYLLDRDVWFATVKKEKTLIKTTDGGKTWKTIFEASQQLYGIDSDADNIITIDSWATEYYISKDNGETWETKDVSDIIDATVYDAATSVAFIDENNGFIGSRGAAIFQTTDGGETWEKLVDEKDSSPFGGYLNAFKDVMYTDTKHLIAVGYEIGYIYEETIDAVEEESLYRSIIYPNPANIGETLTFSIPTGKYTASIYTAEGALLKTTRIQSNNIAIDNDFSTGTYFIIIEENGKVIGRDKFIVE